MNEKRKYNRLYVNGAQKAIMAGEGMREEMNIIDVSAGGISVSSVRPMAIGTPVCGEFNINSCHRPFFIRGQVIRTTEKENQWKTVVQFEKIRIAPVEAV